MEENVLMMRRIYEISIRQAGSLGSRRALGSTKDPAGTQSTDEE